MVDVSLRHKPRRIGARLPSNIWSRPLVLIGAAIVLPVALGLLFWAAITGYRESLALTGLTSDPTPVELAIGTERLAIPANMIRYARTRRGGPVERADLALLWPGLEGYSDLLAESFKDSSPSAPIVYATVAARDSPLDSTARLDSVYARFFVGKALPGPSGLVGRQLDAGSGYEGEVVYFAPADPRPFVARCLAESTPDVPPTCLRDVNFGRSLSLLYRFNRDLLGDWRALDTGVQKLAARFLLP
jgi:hypothetical protein